MMSTHHDGLQQNTKLTKPFYKQEQNAHEVGLQQNAKHIREVWGGVK